MEFFTDIQWALFLQVVFIVFTSVLTLAHVKRFVVFTVAIFLAYVTVSYGLLWAFGLLILVDVLYALIAAYQVTNYFLDQTRVPEEPNTKPQKKII